VARVTLATRAPVRFVNQRPYGRDIHFWWWLTRFDTRPLDSTLGAWLNRLADGKGLRVLTPASTARRWPPGCPTSARCSLASQTAAWSGTTAVSRMWTA
jgi:hypothetical protein